MASKFSESSMAPETSSPSFSSPSILMASADHRPSDPDARITKMKDGRTHLAHKAEHAVDLESGAVVSVTVQDADQGDTTTSIETLIEAAEQVEAVVADSEGPKELVADKGYHSNQALVALEAVGVRSYISEPDRGRLPV